MRALLPATLLLTSCSLLMPFTQGEPDGGTDAGTDADACTSGTICHGECVDTETSNEHCGRCDRWCMGGTFCVEGLCACPDGSTSCDNVCIDLMTNAEHCGRCHQDCLTGVPCVEGECSCADNPVEQLGPLPYLSREDSPFSELDFAWFHLEDFEDGVIETPGLLVDGGRRSSSSGGTTDSVDGDDGDSTDGVCTSCDAWWAEGTVTYTFDSETLGALPTHVGLVWVDGCDGVTFEVTGPCEGASGITLLSVPAEGFADDSWAGETAEDRFLGVISERGIASVSVTNYCTRGEGVETDHVQYGRAP